MPDIKLVLTDMDGTIVQFGKHEVSERVREAVIACENVGIKVAAVTGRPFEMAQPVLEILGFEDLCVFDNGATIINPKTGEVVYAQLMEAETVRQVANAVLPFAKIIDYAVNLDEHVPADNEAERIAAIDFAAASAYALVSPDKLDDVSRELDKIADISYYDAASTRSEYPDYRGLQITHIRATKFHGVEALRAISGISKEETLGIGDHDNDLPLFENAGLKIAMGNASDKLKAEADHIVASVDDDGFVEAMERFVLKAPLD